MTRNSPARSPARIQGTVAPAFLMLAAIALLAVPVAAHPPSDMVISYDPSAAKISVTLTHTVADPTTHYLKTVRVKLNNLIISDPDYKSQPTKDTFTYTYDATCLPGDTIRVTAICNQGGTLEKVYDVTEPATTIPTAPAGAPTPAPRPIVPPVSAPVTPAATAKSPPGLLPLIGAVGMALAMRR